MKTRRCFLRRLEGGSILEEKASRATTESQEQHRRGAVRELNAQDVCALGGMRAAGAAAPAAAVEAANLSPVDEMAAGHLPYANAVPVRFWT
ncbi:hypothetical protein A4X09_0g7019 [Tilletia walkeri]|uniref:Uncharacterized protein n=1 Tax=Tilletia walkeri TaxID=117179 RepID=A0A8X7N4A5_9BASI|nr:hypothetical protein A4X09_0g7019 [Tilletia walkeri]